MSAPIAVENGHFGSDYKTIKVVGKGGSATVYKGILTNSDRVVAIKQIDTDGLNKEQILNIQQEIDTIKVLSHEHIVSYLGTRTLQSKILIFLEYADRGSLRQFYQRRGSLTEPQAANCTRQIIKGLAYLHDNGIAHRDIKCANCLLTKGGIIKLGDFGASKRFESDSVVSGLKGTPHWMAPEVIKGTQMTTGWMKADVWSLGCTVVEMVTGQLPYCEYDNPMTAMFHIANGKQPCLQNTIVSDDLHIFIKACCDVNPELRPTAPALFAMPFPARHKRKTSSPIGSKDVTPQNSPTGKTGEGNGSSNNGVPAKITSQVLGAHMGESPGLGSAHTALQAVQISPFTPARYTQAEQETPDALSDERSIVTNAAANKIIDMGVNSSAALALKDKTGSDTGSHAATATEELVEVPYSINKPARIKSRGLSAASEDESLSAGPSMKSVESEITASYKEGSFSLEQMILDAERLKTQKSQRDAAAAAVIITANKEDSYLDSHMTHKVLPNLSYLDVQYEDRPVDAFHATDSGSDNEERDGDDSDLDLEGYNEADDRGSNLSLSQLDGRLSSSGTGLGVSAASVIPSDMTLNAHHMRLLPQEQCIDMGLELKAVVSDTLNDNENAGRVEYIPKVSTTDPQRRLRPQDRPQHKSSRQQFSEAQNMTLHVSPREHSEEALRASGSGTFSRSTLSASATVGSLHSGSHASSLAAIQQLPQLAYPHPSVEPLQLHSQFGYNRQSGKPSMRSFDQIESNTTGTAVNNSDETAATTTNASSSGSNRNSVESRHIGMLSSTLRLSNSGSTSSISPGASVESFEKAVAHSSAAVRRQALEEVGGLESFGSISGTMYMQGQEGQHYQQQQRRLQRKATRSKSANAAGQAQPIPGSRLPPMAASTGIYSLQPLALNASLNSSVGTDSSMPVEGHLGIATTGNANLSLNGIADTFTMGPSISTSGYGLPLTSYGGPPPTGLSAGMPWDYSSRSIHSAPAVSRSENFALPPIQTTMTPVHKTKVAPKLKLQVSNSSDSTLGGNFPRKQSGY